MLRTREIRGDHQNWADHVFDEDYHLPELKDIAKYIDKNHHLPNAPSEKEIETDGLDLGEMQKIQMQKIEELTLYLIEMDSKMDEMSKEIERLKKENEDLKKK